MVARGRGAFIVTGSGSALAGTGAVASYSASKAYVLNLAEAIGWELRETGVVCQAVVAPAMDTPGWRSHPVDEARMLQPAADPRVVVDAALDQLAAGGRFLADPGLEFVAGLDRAARVELLSSVTELALPRPLPPALAADVGRPRGRDDGIAIIHQQEADLDRAVGAVGDPIDVRLMGRMERVEPLRSERDLLSEQRAEDAGRVAGAGEGRRRAASTSGVRMPPTTLPSRSRTRPPEPSTSMRGPAGGVVPSCTQARRREARRLATSACGPVFTRPHSSVKSRARRSTGARWPRRSRASTDQRAPCLPPPR